MTDRPYLRFPHVDSDVITFVAADSVWLAHVQTHGQGRLGYLHIPDMMAAGWAQLHRDLEQATQREGLVVDVRYNRGGHTSQLVIERLARRVQAYQLGRHGRRRATPNRRPADRSCSLPTSGPVRMETSSRRWRDNSTWD